MVLNNAVDVDWPTQVGCGSVRV